MTVLIKRRNGDIEEIDVDAILADGERLVVPMRFMDDGDKLAAGERAKEQAYQKYKERVANAWKGSTNTPPAGSAQLPGKESSVGAGQRIVIAKQ